MLGELALCVRILPRLCEPTTHNRDSRLLQLTVGIAKSFNDGATPYAFNGHYVKRTFAEKLSPSQKFK
jgi:hypothetical protein